MVLKGHQSPPYRLEDNYSQLSWVYLNFMLLLAMKIAGVILHLPLSGRVFSPPPLHGLCVWTVANKHHCMATATHLWPTGTGPCHSSAVQENQSIPRLTNMWQNVNLFSLIWCFRTAVISYGAVGLVPSSPHERALPDAWGCCYCFSSQNCRCGFIAVSRSVSPGKTCSRIWRCSSWFPTSQK